ncbi:MAG TPA: aldo/keto reductase [Candidatus Binataceae bacterium]|nr:aldo/keto reductase [Candidatus Binataceae bacterium]
MEYRNLGKSGLKVSTVGLGCNNFGMRIDLEAARAVVARALDEGITLFDTADIYGGRGASEEMLGKALGDQRHNAIVATKFGMPFGKGPYLRGGSRRYIFASVEGSLKRLNTDYIDLYQIHQPDSDTPQEETLEALTDLVRTGRVRYLGCSNFAAWQLVESLWNSDARNLASYVSAQNEYSLLDRSVEKELAPACRQFGVGILPFFPLASGLLTGKYKRGVEPPKDTRFGAMKQLADRYGTEANWNAIEKMDEFARSRGHSMLELAMSWLAANPCVSSVIAGATRPEQVADNAKAADWKLTPEDLTQIDKILKQ